MCPQELRSERQCTRRGQGRQRREKDAKCKHRLETALSPRVKQTSPHDSQTDRQAARSRASPLKTKQYTRTQLWRTVGQWQPLGSLSQDGSEGRPGNPSVWSELEECSSLLPASCALVPR